jgi:DNA-directed RNA polymerase specialized sigma24 family protein
VTGIDERYRRVQQGDPEAFASWVRLCEAPLHRSLRGFAAVIDVEAVLQEGLLRMWKLAPTLTLEGENASLRYALAIVRRLALSEIRRHRREVPADLAAGIDPPADPVRPDDPQVARAIRACLDKLPPRPREAMLARLRGGPDRDLARAVRMKLNTFLQNIVRARRLLAECLRGAGVQVEDYL